MNMELFNAALDHSKRNKGGVFKIVDISKAFDTVSHSAIKPVLARKGIPTPISDIISDMYKDCKTSIREENNEGVEIGILRGVEQGDTLLPLLFNLCMEPLLDEIEEKPVASVLTIGLKSQSWRSLMTSSYLVKMRGRHNVRWICFTNICSA
jgi:hypothetical protein